MYATLQSVTDTLDITTYSYEFDLSTLLTKQLREDRFETLDMLLVPVTIMTSTTTNSATVVSSVRQQQTVSATKIRSAKNGMKLEIVYSGF